MGIYSSGEKWRSQKTAGITTITYLPTSWCRVLPEKLTGLQLVKFPAFHGTQRFITALTSVRHLSLSWASPIQSMYPHPTFWRSILILSTHLCLGLPSGLLPSSFPTKNLYTPLITHNSIMLSVCTCILGEYNFKSNKKYVIIDYAASIVNYKCTVGCHIMYLYVT